MPQTDYVGLAPATQLVGTLTAAAGPGTVISLLSGTGYPTGATGVPFVLTLDRDTSNEEKILCSLRSGGNVTISQRGYDDTVAVQHVGGSVEHTVDATVLRIASAHTYDTTRDDHTQYARADGTRTFTGGLTVTRASDGVSATVTRGAASMSGGSLVVSRDATTKPQSLVFSAGVAVNMIMGRQASTDHLDWGYDGGGGFVQLGRLGTGGDVKAAGQTSLFGRGVFGAANAFTQLGDDGSGALVNAGHGTAPSTPLQLRPKGTSAIDLQNGSGTNIAQVADGTGSQTSILAYVWTLGAMRRFEVGAVDSGGAGYRMIRCAN